MNISNPSWRYQSYCNDLTSLMVFMSQFSLINSLTLFRIYAERNIMVTCIAYMFNQIHDFCVKKYSSESSNYFIRVYALTNHFLYAAQQQFKQ